MAYQYTKHIAAGQLHAGKKESDILHAYLGTCVGLALYDESKKIGGMIHILLPEPPSTDSVEFPEKYASTGVPMLIDKLIELDMKSGRTCINPAFENYIKPQEKRDKPNRDDIHKTIDQLKPIPQTAIKILRIFQSDQSNISQITTQLSHDQVLAGKTLKLCNSAIFAGSIKIDSLKDAVLLLGENMLIKSIITAAVNGYFAQTGTSGYSLCRGGLFFHAVGVASLCEKISEKSMGITHCTAGAFLAEKWNFPDGLSQVIKFHHTPEKAEDNKELVYIVYLADLLMEKFYTGLDLEKMQTKSFENTLDHLGLTMEEIPDLIDTVPMNDISYADMENQQ